jgi:RHS repeat-associated protein
VHGYAYDAVGNRILESLDSSGTVTVQMTSHETTSNRLVEVTSNGTSIRTFSHDAAGNLVTDNRSGTAYTYRYNNRGRLDELSTGSTVTAGYSYDGLDRMAIRTVQTASPSVTMHYVYDRAGHLIAEATAAGVVTREYVWLDDMPLALPADLDTAAPNLWFVHADHLDRPIRMTDGTKSVVWNAFFLPFGAVDVILGPASNNLRFPGQYFLLESGLHYNWYRHYDPTLGRYTQADPLGFVDGPSLYAYVGGNPVGDLDPTGEFGLVGAGIGAGIELGLQLLGNGGNLKCIDWTNVGLAVVAGALTGGLAEGAFALKAGSNTWGATRKWLGQKLWDLEKGQEVHHWFIDQGSAIGKMVPNAIKNQPWNLNPMPSKAWHDTLHELDPITRTLLGAPGLAQGTGVGAGVAAAGSQLGGNCGCQ